MPKITNILVICGPTASGKTSLAIEIAKVLHQKTKSVVNILSVDSRQVYDDLDLVTGKDIPIDLPSSIKLYGIDVVKRDSTVNLWEFSNYAKNVIRKSLSENTPLIIVGGTGLYLKSITSDYLNVNVPKDEKLRTKLESLDKDALQKLLLRLNPAKYHSLNHSDANNPRRLIRAIEISSSRSASDQKKTHKSLPGSVRFVWIGIHQSKESQSEKIRQRVVERIESGAINEVKKLIQKLPDKNLPIYTSLGTKNIIDYLDGKITKEELIDQWTSAEIKYARRQMVWFRKQPGIIWYDKGKINKSLAIQMAAKLKK